MSGYFEMTEYGTIRKLWLEEDDPEPEVDDDDTIYAARYRRNAAMDIAAHILGKLGFALDDIVISCPKSNKTLTEKGIVKVNRFHSSASFVYYKELIFVDELLEEMEVGRWNVRLWFDITMGKKLRQRKPVTKENTLTGIKDAIAAIIGDDEKAERLFCTYVNTISVLTPMAYCKLKGMNPTSFMPRMFEVNDSKMFSKVYCQVATSFAQWYINYLRKMFS